METDNSIDAKAHMETILSLADRLSAIIEAENRRMQVEGQDHAIVTNDTLQQSKTRLYNKFGTLARMIGQIAQSGELRDKQLVLSALPRLMQLRRNLTINNTLLKNHIDLHQRLLASIMSGIESQNPAATTDSEQTLCR
jgi:hypothetical protein